MEFRKKIIRITMLFSIIFTIIGGTFAYFVWYTPDEQRTVINFTATGGFSCSATSSDDITSENISLIPTDCSNEEHVIKREITTSVSNFTGNSAYLSMWIEINELGSYLANSDNFKYSLTSTNTSCDVDVISSGNFKELQIGEKTDLVFGKNFQQNSDDTYYLWIWLDKAETEIPPEDEEALQFDFSLNGECSELMPEYNFEITTVSTNYQLINATVVNSGNNIVSYAVTNDNVEPVFNNFDKVMVSPLINNKSVSLSTIDNTSWIDIPVSEQNKVYIFSYAVSDVGTYYIWFKDSKGQVISQSVSISEIYNDGPICSFSEFSTDIIKIDDTASINLTCIDNVSEIIESDITKDDIVLSNNSVNLSNQIQKESIENGYRYTFTIIGTNNSGNTSLTLKDNIIVNEVGNGNISSTSGVIKVFESIYNITYKDVGNTEFSGVHEEGYPTEYYSLTTTLLDMPSKNGYTFLGYFLDSEGNNQIYKIDETYTEDIVLYAKWKDNPPYGTASLSLLDRVFTISLSDYGDEGSGITNIYGYALISAGSCSDATYTNSSELSMTYEEDFVNNTTYYGCIKLTDNSGSIAYIKSNEVEYLYFSEIITYTEVGEHEFVVPATGTYKLEVWGAEGATSGGIGGYGGYSIGSINLEKNKKIFINIGGIGNVMTGGYNGGGNGSSLYSTGDAYKNGGGGGGATHIAKVQGKLSTLEGYKGALRDDGLSYNSSDILIVAGGGGGGAYISENYNGGSGGGISGINGTGLSVNPVAGTQITGYLFGLGQNGLPGDGSSWGESGRGGGGGGFYGGNASQTSTNGIAGGGGGSGYIGSSLLTDKYMYCYNCDTSDNEHTKTFSTGEVTTSELLEANKAKSGDGAAKISYNIFNNISTLALTYNNNGGSGCYSKTIVTGFKYGNLCTPIREGYKFNGWYTSLNYETEITSDMEVAVTENQTLYAKWIESTKPIITFGTNGNDGYVVGNVQTAINVSKGTNSLDSSTFKYTWSQFSDVDPDANFINGQNIILENASGIYYLIAEVCDIEDICTREISNPFYVDNTVPHGNIVLSLSATTIDVGANVIDLHSGISSYGYLIQTESTCPMDDSYLAINNSNYSFVVDTSTTYYVCVKVTDNVGNVSYFSDSAFFVGILSYTSSGAFTYTVPVTGYYQLEVWGAQGGGAEGYGGYATGVVLLKGTDLFPDDSDTLYINIGGEGSGTSGGYNGGGSATTGTASNGGGGGGATHIATESGKLSTLYKYEGVDESPILIVAGGGGGNGGHGGGYKGTGENSGTQTSGNAFGQGGNGSTLTDGWGETFGGNGGGGGYYGGAGNLGTYGTSGGSGYIGNSLLLSYDDVTKHMYCYECSTSSNENTRTYTTGNVDDTPISDYAKSGKGAARITFKSNENLDDSIFDNDEFLVLLYENVGESQFQVETTGYYQLEAWGAQGGYESYGGYSTGVVYLKGTDLYPDDSDTLYINIGGEGSGTSGGYNGGGSATTGTASNGGGGGGATHVATVSGKLSGLSQYAGVDNSPILIVAGGGGGNGGHGGGYKGTGENPGTQTSGNAFGQGGNGSTLTGGWGETFGGNGGGGGYYGGAGNSGTYGTGGGSGYIGNSLLLSYGDITKHMYCYECSTSGSSSTLTYQTTNATSAPVANYAKKGSGSVRITLISADE